MTFEPFTIRAATIEDAETIASHRTRMFQEMGEMSPEAFNVLREKSAQDLRAFFASGEYLGWLAHPPSNPKIVAGGAGVQLRRALAHPLRHQAAPTTTIAEGRHAIILNVFTEPEWRRQGIALELLRTIIAWARAEGIESLVLHSSEAGRSLYERLGFIQTNEMRLSETKKEDSEGSVT